MKEQFTQPRTLRQRAVLAIESVAVIIAVIVALAYVNDVPTPDVADTPDSEVAELQATLPELATQSEQVASIDIDVVKSMAWQEVARGNYQAAIAQYNLVIATDPNDSQAWLERGIALARSGDHERAIEDYNRARELEPNNALILYNKGISQDALGAYLHAIDSYSMAIDLDSNYAYAWNNRGYVYALLDEWNQAVLDYSSAISLDPTYATAYNNRAIAYTHLNNHLGAQADYETAIELNPQYYDAYYNYGVLMYKQGKFQPAMNAFHMVIKSDIQKTPQMWNNHGSALHRLGQYSNAITSYTQALKLDPNYELAQLNRAIAYRDLGEYQAAVDDYSSLLASNPYRYDLYLARGNALENIEPSSATAGISYLQYLRRNGIMPHSMLEVHDHDFQKEFNIGRNQLHQFRVFVYEGDVLDFSVISSSAEHVDPMIVLMQEGVILTGNDDTDQTLNSALFDVTFEQSGWVSVYVGLAGGGVDRGQVLFSMHPAQ